MGLADTEDSPEVNLYHAIEMIKEVAIEVFTKRRYKETDIESILLPRADELRKDATTIHFFPETGTMIGIHTEKLMHRATEFWRIIKYFFKKTADGKCRFDPPLTFSRLEKSIYPCLEEILLAIKFALVGEGYRQTT